METADNRAADAQSAGKAQSPTDEESLLDLLATMLSVVRQTWADRVALVRAEARLAFKSIVLIMMLMCALALVTMVGWVTVLVAFAYYAVLQGLHWFAVASLVLLANVLMGGILWWRMNSLSRLLTFSATRQSFAKLDKVHQTEG